MNIYQKYRIALGELYKDAFDYLSVKYQQASKQFSVASAWGQLLNAFHEISQLHTYYIEDSITELNPNSALRDDSIRGLSTLSGHKPFLGNAASGVLMLYRKQNGEEITADNVILPNYTQLINMNNGLTYSILLDTDYILINKDFQGTMDIKVTQGTAETQVLTGTGEPLQSFNIPIDNQSYFDFDTINVVVNGTKWERVESLLEMSYEYKEYYINAGITGGLNIYFGNKLNGDIPPLGAIITVQYIKHVGENGNINIENPVFNFTDSLFNSEDEEVEANKFYGFGIRNNIIFGANAENVVLTKQLMNRNDRSNILYTPTSFELFFKKYNLFSKIKAFKTTNDNIIQDDNIIYLLLIPDIKKRLSSAANYFSIPTEYFKLTSLEKTRITKMIDESGRKPSQLEISIIDPIIRKYVLNIYVMLFESSETQKLIAGEKIKEIIGTYFLYNTRTDRIPKSDIIRLIEDVDNVDSVSCNFIGEKNEKYIVTNPDTTIHDLIGLDQYNDIILAENEIAVLRGNWTDSVGNKYTSNLEDELSMLNIIYR